MELYEYRQEKLLCITYIEINNDSLILIILVLIYIHIYIYINIYIYLSIIILSSSVSIIGTTKNKKVELYYTFIYENNVYFA